MELASLSRSVQELWQFLYSPTIVCLFMALIAMCVGRDAIRRWRIQERLRNGLEKANDSKNILEFYGLSKIVPLMSVLILLIFLQAIGILSTLVGDALPPHLSTLDTRLLLKCAGAERLAEYWQYHPEVHDIWALGPSLRQDAKTATSGQEEDSFSLKHWDTERSKAHERFCRTKFLILWSAVVWICGGWTRGKWASRTFRLLGTSLVLAVATTAFALQYFYAWEQYTYSSLSAAFSLRAKPLDHASCSAPPALTNLIERISNENGGRRLEPWWQVRIVDGHYIRWMRETFSAMPEGHDSERLHGKPQGADRIPEDAARMLAEPRSERRQRDEHQERVRRTQAPTETKGHQERKEAL